jgi:glucose/arabinose dehydrogenase
LRPSPAPDYDAPIPGDSRVYVVEKGGNVYRFDPATGSRTLVLDITDISTDGERGLLGLAAYPDHAASQRLFATVSAPDGTLQVRRYTLGRPDSSTVYDTVLNVYHPTNNRYGGWIGFGPDGFVYVTTGDGGEPSDARQMRSQRGKILRFTVGASGSTYAPAPGNISFKLGDPYVYASGLRNPFRASFHGSTLLIGDVGEDTVEEIDMITTTQTGKHFGWPEQEGTQLYWSREPADAYFNPVAEYRHGNGPRQGNSITGGYVYRGPVTALRGHYVFADFVSNNIWSVPFASLADGKTLDSSRFTLRNEDFTPDAGTLRSIASFGEDSAGNLLLVSLAGDIFMVRQGR